MNIINLSIDVKKLDKRFFIQGKTKDDGTTPLYVNLSLIPNKDGTDQYGNCCFVVQGTDKATRESMQASGQRMPILGNGKEVGAKAKPSPPPPPADLDGGDEVPF